MVESPLFPVEPFSAESFSLGKAHLLPRGIGLWAESTSQEESTGEGPPALALSPREEAQWQTLTHPRRRLEWRQSRLMAKRLLSQVLGGAPESFELLSQEAGPPLLLRGGKPLEGGRLSVSHTPSYVGVAFAPFAVGLDICDKADAPRIARIAHRAFSEDEAALSRECPEHFAVLWALKEATLKMQGGGVFLPGLSSIRVQCLFPPALASPRADVSLYALPLAYVALACAPCMA